MALKNFIPQIWAARLLVNLNNAHIYAQADVINRDYEGDISSMGDTVKINGIGRVTISDYTKDTNMSDPEQLNDAGQTLTITQSKAFNFAVDDIDKAQQKPKVMDAAMGEAAWGLNDKSDLFIAGLYTDIDAGNFIGSDASPIIPNLTAGTTMYDYLVQLKVKLDNANTPREGRFCIVPPWAEGFLLRDELFVSFGTKQNLETLQNGIIGAAAGFTILSSNNVPNIAAKKHKIIAGHKVAWSYAEQIVTVEGYRPEKRFADAMKGLHVYGAKVTRPSNLAVLVASDS